MKTKKHQRERILLLAHILSEESDKAHPIGLATLIAKLHEEQAGGERKSIYKDLAALKRYGMKLRYQAGKYGGWYLEKNVFSLEQVITLQDALSVYPCVSEEERKEIARGLRSMLSVHQRDKLNRPVRIYQKASKGEESTRKLLSEIHRSIRNEQYISFISYRYNCKKEHLETVRHSMIPQGVLWEDGRYYLFGWESAEGTVTFHPLDRMREILKLGPHEEDPVDDLNVYLQTKFGHRTDCIERVYFYCKQQATDALMRYFGDDIELKPEGDGFLFVAKVQIGMPFWGFMVEHCEEMTIVSPSWRAKEWREEFRPRIPSALIDPLESKRFLMFP